MKIILGMSNCQKCKAMKEKHPDWQYAELDMSLLVALGRAVGISSMPMVLSTDDE